MKTKLKKVRRQDWETELEEDREDRTPPARENRRGDAQPKNGKDESPSLRPAHVPTPGSNPPTVRHKFIEGCVVGTGENDSATVVGVHGDTLCLMRPDGLLEYVRAKDVFELP